MSWTHLRDSRPVARKTHQCSLCEYPIPAGERHVYRTGTLDGELSTDRMHGRCAELADRTYEDDGDWGCHDAAEFRRVLEEQQNDGGSFDEQDEARSVREG